MIRCSPAPSRPAPAPTWACKWRLAPWIISQFPPHRTYVQPYGGGAAACSCRSAGPAPRVISNDLDDEVVDFFRVLRDPATAQRLIAGVAS